MSTVPGGHRGSGGLLGSHQGQVADLGRRIVAIVKNTKMGLGAFR